MKRLAIAITLALGGCAQGEAVVANLNPPPARYMQPLKPCPKTPEGVVRGDGAMRRHLADVKRVCAEHRRTARGLQAYARALTGTHQ